MLVLLMKVPPLMPPAPLIGLPKTSTPPAPEAFDVRVAPLLIVTGTLIVCSEVALVRISPVAFKPDPVAVIVIGPLPTAAPLAIERIPFWIVKPLNVLAVALVSALMPRKFVVARLTTSEPLPVNWPLIVSAPLLPVPVIAAGPARSSGAEIVTLPGPFMAMPALAALN